MISEKLAGIYTKAEDRYFDTLDFLDGKGLPVYKYSDFFENRGIPSFVVTIAIIVAILVLLTVGITYHGTDVSQLTLSLKSADGSALNNVRLSITDSQGQALFEGLANDGQKINLLRGLYNGEQITITASIEGYQPNSVMFTIGEENNVPKLSFSKAYEGTEAKIRITDKETNTIITGANVLVTLSADLQYKLDGDANGLYKKTTVPQGVTVLLKITAEGYNPYEQQVVFREGEVKEIALEPSNQSFVGKAALMINVADADGKAIDDAKVTVYDKTTSNIIFSDYTAQGSVAGPVDTGKPLRVIVEKLGYLTYDSDKEGAGYTIRKQEDRIDVVLEQGGKKLHITVLDAQSGFGVDGAKVQIFRENLALFGEGITTTSGFDFNGLDPLENIYVIAQKEGYLPVREKVAVSSTDDVRLTMDRVTSTNASILEIFSVDAKGVPVNGVKVEVYQILDGNKLPYAATGTETSFAGYAEMKVSVGKTYQIYGSTEVLEATINAEVKATDAEKKVVLVMQKKPNILEMRFTDSYGRDILGDATIAGLDGTILFDGNLFSSRAFFDAEQREVVEVQVLLADGNIFTENVTVKGKDYVEVMVYSKDPAELSPTMEFVGLENENGEVVRGITPGAFYWAKFSVAYPKAATKGGVHFRTGSDNTTFVESERVGIFDISFAGAESALAYSYSPTPEPGNEAIDRANSTLAGEKSKWVEGVISSPQGTHIVKVKLRAEDFTEGKLQLHYRAWSIVDGEYYRTPQDTTLGTSAYVDTRNGLYAETSLQELTLYESLPECNTNLCITTNFVDDAENFIDSRGFEALVGKTYGLEVQVSSAEADYVQVTVRSDSNIDFSSTQTGTFNFVRETDAKVTGSKTAAAALTVSKDGKEKTRFYFTANAPGAMSIKVMAVGKESIDKNILFKAVNEKTLLIDLSESQIMAGKNFTVKVADSGLAGVTNALVKIIDKEGKIVKSVIGDASDGKGKNGYYRIQNDLSVGVYTVEVSAAGYATNSAPILVTIQNVLTFTDTIEAKMPQGQKTLSLSEDLTNNSDFTIQNISVQTDMEADSIATSLGESVATTQSAKFKVSIIAPPAMSPNQKQPVQITVTYTGALEDTADETATLTISGMVEGKFITKVISTLHMMYNRKLDPSCLVMNPTTLSISVLGEQQSTEGDVIEVTNHCDQAIYLTLRRPIKEMTRGSMIIVDGDATIDMQPGETKNLSINVTNLISRGNVREQIFGYQLTYDSNYLKKTLNVNVRTINPMFALSYPSQLTLWLAQSSTAQKATAAQQFFVSNISSFPVENITFTVDKEYASGSNVDLTIEPPGTVSLDVGQGLSKIAFAKASSKVSEPVRAKIIINGRMGRLNNRAGQYDQYGSYNYYNGNYNGNSYYGNTYNAYGGNYTNSSGYNNNYYSGASTLNSYNPNYYGANTNYNYNNNYNTGYNNSSYGYGSGQALGEIYVTIFYSGYNCLTAILSSNDAGAGMWGYVLPEAGGQIAKKISITNNCAEPVRVISATPAGVNQERVNQTTVNPLLPVNPYYGVPGVASSVMLSLPQISISPGQNVIVPMTVISAIPNLKREHYGVTVNGITEVSQTPISSKPFFINIKTGNLREEEVTKANQTNVNVCGEGDKKQQVMVPKTAALSGTPNCAENYCDGISAARYIAAAVRKISSRAAAAGYGAAGGVEDKNPCIAQGACTFEELGMDEVNIKLYLQADTLSPGVLQKELNSSALEGASTTPFRETLESTGFIVEPMLVESSLLKMRALGGYDRVVFLDPQIAGCGYYELTITGAFRMSGVNDVALRTPILMIRTNSQTPRLVTKQCQESMVNVSNFNPIDEGLDPGKEYGTWLTTIEAEPALQDIAKALSKSRYKSDNRIAAGNGAKLKLVQGGLSGALAMMCVSGDERKTITVTVDNSFNKTSPGAKDAFSQQIIKMVGDSLAGNFGSNCLVRNGEMFSCVKLTDPGTSGSRKIELLNDSKITMVKTSGTTQQSCVEGTLYSNFPEDLKFSVTPGESLTGIRTITVSATNDDDKGPKIKPSAQATTTTTGTTLTTNPASTIPTVDSTATNKEAGKIVTPPTPPIPPAPPATTSALDERVEKISFADVVKAIPVSTTSTATDVKTTVNEADTRNKKTEYYHATIKGGGAFDETSINYPIELYKYTGAKGYSYYRNIKICVSPGDFDKPEATTTDKRPLYASAKGTFDIGVRNANQGEGTDASSRKTVTLQTGTLHPDDLVKYICEGGKKSTDDYSGYFVITWAQGKDELEFGPYIESQKRKGLIDNCVIFTDQSGYDNTPAFSDKMKNIKANAVLTQYLPKCAAVSAGLAAVTTPGALIGIAIAPIFDCVVPAFTNYKSDLAANSDMLKEFFRFFDGLVEPVKNIPIIGDIAKSIFGFQEELPGQKAGPSNLKIITDSVLKTYTTLGGKTLSSWPLGVQKYSGFNLASRLGQMGETYTAAGLDATGTVDPSVSTTQKIGAAIKGTSIPAGVSAFARENSEAMAQQFIESLSSAGTGAYALDGESLLKLKASLAKQYEETITESMIKAAQEEFKTNPSGKFSLSRTTYASTKNGVSFAEAAAKAVEAADAKTIEVLFKPRLADSSSYMHMLVGADPKLSLDKLIEQFPPGSNLRSAAETVFASELDEIARAGKASTYAGLKVELEAAVKHIPGSPGTTVSAPVAASDLITTVDTVGTTTALNANGQRIKDWFVANEGLSVADAELKAKAFNGKSVSSTSTVQSLIDDYLATKPKLTKVTDEQLKKLANMMDTSAQKDMEKLLEKSGFTQATKNIGRKALSGVRNIGLGLGASYLANYIGEQALNKAVTTGTDDMKKDPKTQFNKVPNQTLSKDHEYEIKITKEYNSEWVTVFNEIKDKTDKDNETKRINSGKGEYLLYTKISPKEKPPEERPLNLWNLKADVGAAKKKMAEVKDYPYTEAEQKKHLEIIKDTNIGNLVSAYTKLDSKNPRLMINGAEEGLVLAVLLYDWAEIYPNLKAEEKEFKGILRTKVESLLAKRNPTDKKIPLSAFKEIFNVSDSGAKKFEKTLSFWQIVCRDLSPNIQPTATQTAAVAVPVPVRR